MAIKIKKSTTPGAIPLPTDLAVAELAINLTDRILYSKHPTDGIIVIGGDGSGGQPSGPSSVINWKIKSDNYAALAEDGILADTQTSGPFTLTLPDTPELNERVSFAPFYPTLDIAPVTLVSNTHTVAGLNLPLLINQNKSLEFIFIDPIYGWAIINKGDTAIVKSPVEKLWKVVDNSYISINGDALLADTQTNGPFDLSLPADPVVGNQVSVAPLYNNYSSENLFILPNGQMIDSDPNMYVITTDGRSVEFVFVGGSVGWAVLEKGSTTVIGSSTGGSTLGAIKALRVPFTFSSGTFQIGQLSNNATVVSCSIKVITTFGGLPVLTIGNSTAPNGVCTSADVDLTSTGLYYNRTLFDSLLNGTINGYLSGASGTGSGQILIEYYETE